MAGLLPGGLPVSPVAGRATVRLPTYAARRRATTVKCLEYYLSKPVFMSNDKEPSGGGSRAFVEFVRAIVESDLAAGTHDREGMPSVITRFPPEPNGYLHVGHAKSICLNFGLARDYAGRCHLRFDDTNPEKEDQEYVDTIMDSVKWLGFSWEQGGQEYLHYASDYFDKLYEMAEYLIQRRQGLRRQPERRRHVEKPRQLRHVGTNSPFRNRPAEESLQIFRDMKAGKYKDGEHILRAKMSEDAMSSPIMTNRDPALYRIRHAHHHRTGDDWCIYPMYDYTHPISDALEDITHSLCTLEFQDHRPFYDWLIETLADGGFFKRPVPRQYEFSRLNLTYVVMSKRKLRQLVDENIVTGWDDPRMPTIVGLRRRGYTPESIQLFCERIGVSKADGWIDMSTLEGSLRDDLDPKAPRAVAVLRPLKLIVDNFPEGGAVECSAPVHPHHPEWARAPSRSPRTVDRAGRLHGSPEQGLLPLQPAERRQAGFARAPEVRLRRRVHRLRQGCRRQGDAVHVNYFEDSKSGTPGADNYKVKGNITWVSAATRWKPKCACTTACSSIRTRTPAARTSRRC
jgi:glutaminyl-tRNA synthetase